MQLINIRQALRADTLALDLPDISDGPPAAAVDVQRVISSKGAIEVPRFERSALRREQYLDGPALISDATSTLWLEQDWRGSVDRQGHLLLKRMR